MKKYGIDWIQPKEKKSMLILGSVGLTIAAFIIVAIIVIVLVIGLLGFLAAMLPYLLGFALILGIGYVIVLVLKQPNPQGYQPQESSRPQEDNTDVVATCKSMYDDSSTIKECVDRGGRL